MNDYMLIRRLGTGGTSTVYLGADKRSGEKFAIKKYENDKMFSMAEKEMDLMSSLNHPAIPKIRELICEGETRYVVMEYVVGNTMKEILLREQRICEERAVKWGIELCDVLSYLHRRIPPVVYRDVKPANIILSPVLHVRLIDFGAAVTPYIVKAGEKEIVEIEPVGTPGYAPPEQFEIGVEMDGRADIYALGATLHYMLTGIHPSTSSDPYDHVRTDNRRVSGRMKQILMKCLEPDREKRYHYCEEVKEDLEHISFPGHKRKRLYITRSEVWC